jgi:hypothetical protein
MLMQQDGNLVVNDADGKCTWASDTWKNAEKPHFLLLLDDGRLSIWNKHNKEIKVLFHDKKTPKAKPYHQSPHFNH